MSKYTTEVRYICEEAAGLQDSVGYNNIESVITTAAPVIFDFDFPIFDEAYRLPLEKTILRHYYTREIGEETVGLWKLRLWDRLSLIMPYYNKLYYSETLQFNPLYDVDYTRTSTTDLSGQSSQSDQETTSGQNTSQTSTTNDNNESTTTARGLQHEGQTSGSSNTSEQRTQTDTHTGTEANSTDTVNSGSSTQTTSHTGTEANTNDATVSATKSQTDMHSATASGTSENTNYNLFSDTPQGALTNMNNEAYLTDARKITDSGSTSGSDNSTDTHSGLDTSVTDQDQLKTVNLTDTQTGSDSTTTDQDQLRTVNLTDSQIGTAGTTGSTSGSDTYQDNETVTGAKIGTASGSTSVTGSDSSTRTATGAGTVKNVTEFVEHVIGKQGTYSFVQMIKDYRDALINIDQMIINELSDLFIALW
jgi:hypothetical protein